MCACFSFCERYILAWGVMGTGLGSKLRMHSVGGADADAGEEEEEEKEGMFI